MVADAEERQAVVHPADNEITTWLAFPDEARNRTGYNQSTIRTSNSPTKSECAARGGNFGSLSISTSRFLIAGSARWDLVSSLFPGTLFGKTWYLDSHSTVFPRRGNRQKQRERRESEVEPASVGHGPKPHSGTRSGRAARLAIESLS